jgi:hypothetical protein
MSEPNARVRAHTYTHIHTQINTAHTQAEIIKRMHKCTCKWGNTSKKGERDEENVQRQRDRCRRQKSLIWRNKVREQEESQTDLSVCL